MPPKPKTDNPAMRELKQALRAGTPGNLYLFHGEEAYLREYYLGELKKILLRDGNFFPPDASNPSKDKNRR